MSNYFSNLRGKEGAGVRLPAHFFSFIQLISNQNAATGRSQEIWVSWDLCHLNFGNYNWVFASLTWFFRMHSYIGNFQIELFLKLLVFFLESLSTELTDGVSNNWKFVFWEIYGINFLDKELAAYWKDRHVCQFHLQKILRSEVIKTKAHGEKAKSSRKWSF